MFLAKKILSLIFMPPMVYILILAIGMALIRRRPRLGWRLSLTGLLFAVLITSPWSVRYLMWPLENTPPIGTAQLRGAQAIVILGGGTSRHALEYDGQTVNRVTLERCRFGARLSRQTALPVLLSGGAPGGGETEAELMREALEDDFKIEVRWLEDASRDTRENALFSSAILKQEKVQTIILVTSAAHMPRASAEFRQAGLTVIPAPTGYATNAPDAGELQFGDFIPNAKAAYDGWFALHEWLGYGLTRLRGWIG